MNQVSQIKQKVFTPVSLFDTGVKKNTPPKTNFSFIDLFAGIGGIRMGFEGVGGECVFTSEWDNYAQKTCVP